MLRRNRNPDVQRLILSEVPVKVVSEWDADEIGNLRVNFVMHCGRLTGGDYIYTISAVDIAKDWWGSPGDCGALTPCDQGRPER